jgi:hypothetical protein
MPTEQNEKARTGDEKLTNDTPVVGKANDPNKAASEERTWEEQLREIQAMLEDELCH